MFDLRYHVASLAAVFFALVIGILVGVALASHGLGSSERLSLQRQIATGQAEINRLNAQLTALDENSKAATRFLTNAYPAVMANRLSGKQIAVLSIGRVDANLRAAVTKTIGDAGGTILRLSAISVPLKLEAIDRELRAHPRLKSLVGKPDAIGRELADEFIIGGDTPLWTALEQQLVEERTGSAKPSADGVVVIRNAPLQKQDTSIFLKALLSELATRPTDVAAEQSLAQPSFVPLYKKVGLSSVDEVDTAPGRVALAVILGGGVLSDGHYGTRVGDTDVLPTIPAVTSTATGG